MKRGFESLQESQKQSVNFLQMRDLTDEEWLRLPKKEILQLYKNCYNILQSYISKQESEKPTDEMIEKWADNRVSKVDSIPLRIFYKSIYIEGAKTLRDGLIK